MKPCDEEYKRRLLGLKEILEHIKPTVRPTELGCLYFGHGDMMRRAANKWRSAISREYHIDNLLDVLAVISQSPTLRHTLRAILIDAICVSNDGSEPDQIT